MHYINSCNSLISLICRLQLVQRRGLGGGGELETSPLSLLAPTLFNGSIGLSAILVPGTPRLTKILPSFVYLLHIVWHVPPSLAFLSLPLAHSPLPSLYVSDCSCPSTRVDDPLFLPRLKLCTPSSSRNDIGAPYTGLLNRTSTPDQDLSTRPSSTNQQLLWQDSPENKNRYSQNQVYPPYQQQGLPDGTAGHRLSHSSGANPITAPFTHAMRPYHGAQLTATSSVGSFDARDRSISSHRSSAHNLAVGHDPNYNMIQSDTALEGLAERWHAYQAWWEKQYKEKPFYQLWTKSKWILLLSALMLLTYSGAAFAVSLGYILGHFEYSAVVIEFHHNLIYITLAGSCVGIFSALVGLIGIFRENRIWLSWYNLMLWPVFALYLSVGYIAFRRSKNHLRAHLKDEWVHSYSRDQRLLVQRSLKCCGYQDSTYFGEYDLRCFPMINLPGCQHKYNLYEDKLLTTCWNASFALVPLQLFVMIAALLCSNHVDGMLRSGRPGLKSFKEKKHRD